MTIHTNKSNFIKNSLRIGSIIVVFIGASFLIPKMADASGNFNHMVPNYAIPTTQNSQDSSNAYEPTDFGRPSSAYGSGTR